MMHRAEGRNLSKTQKVGETWKRLGLELCRELKEVPLGPLLKRLLSCDKKLAFLPKGTAMRVLLAGSEVMRPVLQTDPWGCTENPVALGWLWGNVAGADCSSQRRKNGGVSWTRYGRNREQCALGETRPELRPSPRFPAWADGRTVLPFSEIMTI